MRKSTGSPARRGPFETGRPLSKTRGVTGARRAPTSEVRVQILVSLLHDVAGRSGSVISWKEGRKPSRFDTAVPIAHHDRDTPRLLRAGWFPVIDYASTGRG